VSAEGSLREAWDRSAPDWIRWARSPELDHVFWRLNLPATLALLPEPGDLTLDVGCGEGRLARELIGRGHSVVGIESSPALAQAARDGDPGFEVHEADAIRMPVPDDSADLAVASLSLMNLDDPAAAVAEIARVLTPGSYLCASLLHPLNSWGDARERGAGSYFETARYAEELERDGARMTFHDTHRPLIA
jgi:ubiquinone/menaquinone biosynthesis C-methylase UbiE